MSNGVVVRNSDLFSEPTDIIVLPCSKRGTITDQLQKQISQYDIPRPYRSLQRASSLGDIQVATLAPNHHIAHYVCWAVSVSATYGTLAALRNIGQEVARVAESRADVKLVSCPLLGTGCGGVDPLRSAQAIAEGFLGVGARDVVLRLHVLDSNVAGAVGQVLAGREQPAVFKVPLVTEFTGQQFKQCQQALLAAYDRDELEQMVRFEMNEDLDAIAGGSTLANLVFHLIKWAQQQGKLAQLLQGAVNLAPENPKLLDFVRSLAS